MLTFLLSFLIFPQISRAESTLDHQLQQRLQQLGMDGQPTTSHTADIASPIAQLGKLLFFSRQLSGDGDVACVSCHHPTLGGGDGMPLSIGVGAVEPEVLGPPRRHDGNWQVDPLADGGPNVPRNAQTTFNSSFYQRALFWDGRVQILEPTSDSNRQRVTSIRTPDSRYGLRDPGAGDNLLMAQAKFPVTATTEMRGFHLGVHSNEQVRAQISQRLKSEAGWLERFQRAFAQPNGSAEELIHYPNIARALAAYQASQRFINSPWRAYVAGDTDAISDTAKRGAALFLLSDQQQGANCQRCHRGDFFTDEQFHNLATIQIGRGKSTADEDLGRYSISRLPQDRYAFRTPSLLNVAVTGPYGHSGSHADLPQIILHHSAPAASIEQYDYQLAIFPSLQELNNNTSPPYPHSRANSQRALKHQTQPPSPALSTGQLADLTAFLHTLTDPCVQQIDCLQPWLLSEAEQGLPNMLLATFEAKRPVPAIAPRPSDPTPQGDLPLPAQNQPLLTGAAPDHHCQRQVVRQPLKPTPKRKHSFVNITEQAGLSGYQRQTSPLQLHAKDVSHTLTSTVNFGGVAVGDIDQNCWPDLVLDSGPEQPRAVMMNEQGHFQAQPERLNNDDEILSPLLIDIDGDGWLDLFSGNYASPAARFYHNQRGQLIANANQPPLTTTRNTLSASFADIDRDGDLDMFTSHWYPDNGPEETHLWQNHGGGHFQPAKSPWHLHGAFEHRDFTFTPNFADLNGDQWPDLLVAADFKTSQVFINQQQGFANRTNTDVINDENGMGATLADFDGDGLLDWFVTGVYQRQASEQHQSWGISGNRLYRGLGNGHFEDHTDTAGLRDAGWGWGSCAADFDNDGDMDLLVANGYGVSSDEMKQLMQQHFGSTLSHEMQQQWRPFMHQAARLYINNGLGQFREQALSLGLRHTGQGRGVSCVDIDRDGDIDPLIISNSGPVALYRNQWHPERHFIQIELQGAAPNTGAIGAVIEVIAGEFRQTRQVQFRNNYLSQDPLSQHFGLGALTQVDEIRVTWPDGSQHRWRDLAADQFLQLPQVAPDNY